MMIFIHVFRFEMRLKNNLILKAYDIVNTDFAKENLSLKDATTLTNSDSDSNYRCDKILFFYLCLINFPIALQLMLSLSLDKICMRSFSDICGTYEKEHIFF